MNASDSACEVDVTDLTAGQATFTVTNSGSKVNEFYVYAAGDRVLGEVENIAPAAQGQATATYQRYVTSQTAALLARTQEFVTDRAQKKGDDRAAMSEQIRMQIDHTSSVVFACPPGVRDAADHWGRTLFT